MCLVAELFAVWLFTQISISLYHFEHYISTINAASRTSCLSSTVETFDSIVAARRKDIP